MKRKIALLLVLAMILSLVPANFVSADEPAHPNATLATHGQVNPVRQTTDRNVPINLGFNLDQIAGSSLAYEGLANPGINVNPVTEGALQLGLWFTGGDHRRDNSSFVGIRAANSQIFRNAAAAQIDIDRGILVSYADAAAWAAAHPHRALGTAFTNPQVGPGEQTAWDTDPAVLQTELEAEVAVWITVIGSQHAVITFGADEVNRTDWRLPTSLTGWMSIEFPNTPGPNYGGISVLAANAWAHVTRNPWVRAVPAAQLPILSGPLINLQQPCVRLATGDVVYFTYEAALNNLRIIENAPGEMNRILVDTATPPTLGHRALAIRLIAPPDYFWGATTQGVHFGHPDAPGAPTSGNDGYPVPFPHVYSPNGILNWERVARYVYTGPGGRQEMVIILENLGRTTGGMINMIGEIQLQGLTLFPGERAPTAPPDREVRLDVEVGSVSTLRACNVPHNWLVAAVPNAPTTTNDHRYCHRGFSFFGAYPAAAVNFANMRDVSATPATRFPWTILFNNPNNVNVPAGEFNAVASPNSANWWIDGGNYRYRNLILPAPSALPSNPLGPARRVTSATCPWGDVAAATPDGTHGAGSAAGNVWGLDFRSCRTSAFNPHVATRTTAALRLRHNPDEDLRVMQSGALNYTDNTPLEGRPHTTGRTEFIRIEERVRGALALSMGHPVTYTFPEGVVVTGIRYRVTPVGTGSDWRTVLAPVGDQSPDMNVRFVEPNVVSIRQQLPALTGSSTRNLDVMFYLSVEAGFAAANNTDAIEVVVTGSGAANLGDNNYTDVAEVYDPVRVVHHGNRVPIRWVGNEQNIDHTSIGRITIEETAGRTLRVGDQIWVYVGREYGIGWDLMISRGTQFVDANSGLAVAFDRTFSIHRPNLNATIRGILLTVTAESRYGDDGGVITLDETTLFGHVYQGEVYLLAVTGPAIAANHNVVADSNMVGTFRSLPYGIEVIERVGGNAADNRANSILGVTFNPDVTVDGAPQMIWYRAPGMIHQGGFVGARAFATLAGVAEENINWVGTTRVATIAGWDYQGNWVQITLTQGSPTALIQRGTTQGGSDLAFGNVDIATFADGLTGPPGTVVPVFQHNRIYLPFRFMFNAFGYNAAYDLDRVGNNAVVTAR